MKMNKRELKKWLSTAIDGGCSDAYMVLLNNFNLDVHLGQTSIRMIDLLDCLSDLSKKWQSEISKVTGE